MFCKFPVIKKSIDNGELSIEELEKELDISEEKILKKLSGEEEFDINEAMTINNEFFKDVPFKKLFTPEK